MPADICRYYDNEAFEMAAVWRPFSVLMGELSGIAIHCKIAQTIASFFLYRAVNVSIV